jgi:hypothetical protein
MKVSGLKVLLLIILTQLAINTFAQDEWNTPWIVIGDSALLKPNQKVMVTGSISSDTRERITGASISAETFKYFDYSDDEGRYLLELPAGRYRITGKHIGMKPRYIRLLVLSGGVYNIMMIEGATDLPEIVISSRPIDSNVKQSLPGLTKLNVQEIRTLPTLMGEVDILKSLQLMPGVSSVGEGSSGFNVRGGRTDQNLVLLNDVPMFNTSHALGFISAFSQDIINDFSLYKGNVPANLGGRASSVVEITTRRGDFEKWNFQGGVGPITSRFTAEGPIQKSKTSLIVGGRISYANWALKWRGSGCKRQTFLLRCFAGLSHRISAKARPCNILF